ncbi:MAG: serine O-acetyltransferase [Treponema sp.]|jgi:serine O-acetyltransferase|nr:serine O-acetyltransferase [Treponema sp.]
MQRLAKNVEILVASYNTYGFVNPAGEANLPSRRSVEAIVRELGELIFPGFGEMEELDKSSLALVTTERANRAARNLVREVEKSVAFAIRKERNGSLKDWKGCHAAAALLVDDFFDELPAIRSFLRLDVEAAFSGDPAAKSTEEVILSYPGLEAIMVHRLAHFFWVREVPLIPRIMSEIVHSKTGIDIHPGAKIGESFFIDHGTGVVIGETCVIGKNVKLYQGVTLGALSVRKEDAVKKRHPTIEDNVTIYSGATILGGDTIIGRESIIGGNVWITESVPPGSKVYLHGRDQVVEGTGGGSFAN